MLHKIDIRTRSQVEFKNITGKVADIIRESGVQSGICYVFSLHTTAGITVNENADPAVPRDIIDQLDAFVPEHDNYRHREGNSPAHIKTSLMGDSETLLIEDGKLVLGTWQGVFFCEFDGPRNRHVVVKVVPDAA